MIKYGSISLLLLCVIILSAQEKLYVHKTTGSLLSYNIAEIDILNFGTNNMRFYWDDGNF